MLRARRLWTGDAWMEDAGLAARDGQVVAVGPWRQLRGGYGPAAWDVDGVVVPGVVNAHMHGELSALAGRAPLDRGFTAWAAVVAQPDFWDEACVRTAVSAMDLAGHRLVLDVATRMVRPMAAVWETAGLWEYGLLCESLTYRIPRAWVPAVELAHGWMAPAAHSVYATEPTVLAGAKAWCRAHGRLFSLHAAEREDELCLARERFGAGPDGVLARASSVVAALEALGVLDAGTLLVHGVHLGEADVALLARRRSVVCLCPRSNAALGVGRAPWALLRRSGLPVVLGTDSLASAPDLDVWREAAFLKEHLAPELCFAEALALVTGQALGMGRLAPGAPAAVAVVPSWFAALFS
jgi:cytosine/adenosine deaminase-related metal-dependent hydrolase